MVLSDITIREMIKEGKLIENPVNIEESIQPASYDITLGNAFKVIKKDKNKFMVLDEPIAYKKIVIPEDEYMLIPSLSFILAVTNEIINLPDDIAAIVEGRSSVGRSGLFIHNAGFIDNGFRGTITLELFNASPNTIAIKPGMRIGQIVFMKTDKPSEKPYNGKYQNQIDVTESRIHLDFVK